MLVRHESTTLDPVELRTLRYFVTTAETGTVTAAAEALHVTQPGVSRQLKSLESDLGVDLFTREKGRLELTGAGRSILPLARDILRQSEALRVAAQHHAHGRLERVTVAAPATTLTDIIAPFMANLLPEDPIPGVLESDGWTVAEAFQKGAELVLTLDAAPEPRYAVRQLTALPVFACLPESHRWGGRASLSLAELAREDLICLAPHTSARRVLDAAVRSAGVAPLDFTEASNGTIAQALAAAGRGIALVTDEPRYDLVALPITGTDDAPVQFRLNCVWEAAHPAAESLGHLADRLVGWTAARFA